MKNRSRTEIISMILDAVSSGATKTKIMYKAYLSYAQLKDYIDFMEKNDLIKCEVGAQVYRITEKGIKLMRLCEEVGCMISPKNYVFAKMSSM